MITLERWRRFLTTPQSLVFPRLELIGRDFAPPIVIGSGEVRMESPTSFAFTLHGTPTDVGYVLSEQRRQRQNPYDPLARFRVVGVDAEGTEWNGGYTVPVVEPRNDIWTFSGEIEGLTTPIEGDTVCRENGAELLFLLRINDPMSSWATGIGQTGSSPAQTDRTQEITVLGSSVRFSYEGQTASLLITATGSSNLFHPYAENWLSEPLRIIFGQLIYPRLVARNFGDGRAHVQIRKMPGLIPGARWAALWDCAHRPQERGEFWKYYAQLLDLIAKTRDKSGQPQFESHKITRLYEEVIQATLGSRWVWALTYASSIEALVQEIIKKEATRKQRSANAVALIVERISNWPDGRFVKGLAIDAVRKTEGMSAKRALNALEAAGVISKPQLSAWEDIRNSVMHGSLVSPYSTEEEDTKLLSLANMMHALTKELLS